MFEGSACKILAPWIKRQESNQQCSLLGHDTYLIRRKS